MIPFDTELSAQQIRDHLTEISQRQLPQPGHRQVPFNIVETLLCYGLFYIFDPHKYGGANIDKVPPVVKTLATFFHRTPGSVTNKMLNLDGSRQHSGRDEPLLFASLATEPALYHALYKDILTAARTLALGEDTLPDFLGALSDDTQVEDLLGQDDLPNSASVLLAGEENAMKALDHAFVLGDRLTEKLVERKIRLAQHRFAVDVLQNCGRTCVFCGFAPRTLPTQSGLLRASHIKPWAVSDHRERLDVRNGLAACPTHDAAFDRGYLTVNGGYRIYRASALEDSVTKDPGVPLYFGETLSSSLLLPEYAIRPAVHYLAYHREKHL
jgi:putative restriction endonuclease